MLRVRLLGELEVRAGERTVEPPASRRAWSLLAWLALHPGDHPRGTVASIFWPDVLEQSARGSLRSATWVLRQALGDAGAALVSTRDRVGLRCTTDLGEFDRLLATGEHAAAVELVGGPLLREYDDDWVLEARDLTAGRVDRALSELSAAASTPGEAASWARRRVTLDPFDEAATRELMAYLTASGDRAGALAAYDRLCERFRTQLRLPVSAATRAAAEQVRSPREQEPAPAPRPQAAVRTPAIIGRDAELGRLMQLITEARGGLAILAGEPGIGKTTLALAALARSRADGARTVAAAALALSPPLGPWSELVRELGASVPRPPVDARWPEELGALVPSLPRRLGRDEGHPSPPASPGLARARLFEAIVDALEYAVRDRPLVLLLDDAHLADPASLEALGYVLRRAGSLRLTVLLTRRTVPERPELDGVIDAARPSGPLLLGLGPLPRTEVDLLVRTAGVRDPEVRDGVVDAADGNPLLAVEGARAAVGGLVGPPPGLEPIVRAALGRMSTDARRVAELAAVAGRPLAPSELATLSRPEHAVAALDCGLLRDDAEGFGFRHGLLRDAAEALVPAPRRRELHAALAGALDAPPAELARHLRAAGDLDGAAAQLCEAAAAATRVGAIDEAAAFLHEALALRPDDGEVRLAMADAEAARGHQPVAEAELLRALERLDPSAHPRAHLMAARWFTGTLCLPRRALEHAGRALDGLGAGDELLPAALSVAAFTSALDGPREVTDDLLGRLEDTARTHPGWSPEVIQEAALARAFLLLRDERLDEALDAMTAAAAIPGSTPDRNFDVLINAACVAAALRRYDDALALIGSGVSAARGLPSLLAPLHALRAAVLDRVDRGEDALAALSAARSAAERTGDPGRLACIDHDEGLLAARGGDHPRAAMLLSRALDADAPVSRPLARLTLAESLARSGDGDGAAVALRAAALEPVRLSDRPALLVPRFAHVQGLVAAARGDVGLAVLRLEEALAGWRRHDQAPWAPGFVASLVDLGRSSLSPIHPSEERARVRSDLDAFAVAT